MSVFLVVPCFNEADRWSEDYWANMVEQTNARYVFVDDGSSDETGTLLAEFANRHNVTFVRLATNGGKAEAVRQGWLEILKTMQINEVTALGFLDADGAFSVEDVSALIDLTNAPKESHSPDAWWSSRVALAGRNIQRNLWRHYLGRVVATYLSLGEPAIPYDTQAGLKLFRPSGTFTTIIQTPFATRWLFEVEILARFHEIARRPMSIWEMPLSSWLDVAGSKVTTRESIRIARELSRLKLIQRRGRTSPPELT